MNRYIKVQFLKSGVPVGKAYTYKTSLDVQLGETVMVTDKIKGIIAGFEVIQNIPEPEKIKEIYGQIPKEAWCNGCKWEHWMPESRNEPWCPCDICKDNDQFVKRED